MKEKKIRYRRVYHEQSSDKAIYWSTRSLSEPCYFHFREYLLAMTYTETSLPNLFSKFEEFSANLEIEEEDFKDIRELAVREHCVRNKDSIGYFSHLLNIGELSRFDHIRQLFNSYLRPCFVDEYESLKKLNDFIEELSFDQKSECQTYINDTLKS